MSDYHTLSHFTPTKTEPRRPEVCPDCGQALVFHSFQTCLQEWIDQEPTYLDDWD